MKTFHAYMKIREDAARDVGLGAIGRTSLSSGEKGSMSSLFKIARLAWHRSREQMISAFSKMAAHDPEIKAELELLVGDKSIVSKAVRKAAGLDSLEDAMDKDEITPSDADKNGGGGGDDDDGM